MARLSPPPLHFFRDSDMNTHTNRLFPRGVISFAEEAAEKSLRPPVLNQALLTFGQPAPVFGIGVGLVQHLAQQLNFTLQPSDILVVFFWGRLRNWRSAKSRFWVVWRIEGKDAVKLGWVDLIVTIGRLDRA